MDLITERWGTSGTPIVCVHGSLGAGVAAFGEQKPLGVNRRVVVPYRRGYGDNPPIAQVDIAHDAADVVELLGEGAHLVGTSMGGVVSMIAAGARPDLVRSLTVIEPPAFAAARDIPEVRRIADAMKRHWASADASDLVKFTEGFIAALEMKMALPTPLPAHLVRAMGNLVTERPWRVDVPVGAVADGAYPKLVVTGGWSPAFDAIGERLAVLFDAERHVLPGAGHGVQRLGKPFNDILEKFLSRAERTG